MSHILTFGYTFGLGKGHGTHIHFVGITTITRGTLPWYSEHDTHLVHVCCQVKDSYLCFPMYICESS